ncbi:MAG: lipoyl(octanoyl) transferase LipB [Ichthyobacteriaceae bacterium]|nr:lipoyl(octanoyl) transferase LipB [Ichthyobacteriaceae bacterium]
MNTILVKDLEKLNYTDAWNLQQDIFQKIIDVKTENRKLNEEDRTETQSQLLLVEHPHVYTIGKSGDTTNLLINEQELESKNATFVKVNRGGDITYHGPGQIVGYPILDLDNFFTDIHKYMRFLEEVVIKTLADFNIKGERSEGETGVWIDAEKPTARKICALGVRTSRWVTMHGFALNVNSDLSYFNNIIPCGIKGKAVASMHNEVGFELDMNDVKEKITKYFGEVFESEMII